MSIRCFTSIVIVAAVVGCNNGSSVQQPSGSENESSNSASADAIKSGAAPTELTAESIVGTWIGKIVNGESPETHNIGEFRIKLSEDGTAKYFAAMSGPHQGVKLYLVGTWSLNEGKMTYVAGTLSGETEVSLDQGELVFAADPFIFVGTERGKTRYEKKG